MPIFTERSFRDLLDKLLVIYPLREECITGVGYDLTVGLYVKINPWLKKIEELREIGDGYNEVGPLTLEPNTYLVAISREMVYLSSRVAATFHSKSSHAAQAIFMNSTTGDPDWRGRLIFLLYNASGVKAEMDVGATFATMVVHTVERRSKVSPKDPGRVLTRYLHGFTGEIGPALDYVMRDRIHHDFDAKVDHVKRFANRPSVIVNASIILHRYVYPLRRWARSALLLILSIGFGYLAYLAYSAPARLETLADKAWIPDRLVALLNKPRVTAVVSLCSILSLVAALWQLIGGTRKQ